MEYLHNHGYPVPAVEDLSDDETELVMERIEGRSMAEASLHAPWTLTRQAQALGELHLQLHELSVPEFLGPAPVGRGASIVHLDLHPLNVVIGPKGPVVIDWTNAAQGDPLTDVCLAWLLVCSGQIPDNFAMAKFQRWARRRFADAFLKNFDRERVSGQLREVVSWKARDPHMSTKEIEEMWAMAEHTR